MNGFKNKKVYSKPFTREQIRIKVLNLCGKLFTHTKGNPTRKF